MPAMPRLVSLTLLSVLVLPAAALLYTLTIVVGYEIAGWNSDYTVWLVADAFSFALVVLWWIMLWSRSVEWTAWMISATMLATGGSILAGIAAGILAGMAINEESFGLFIGGGTSVVAWLVSACILWRRGGRIAGAAVGAAGGTGEAIVFCPKCGYALNGLREARCPECGEIYTLDALLRAQPTFGGGADLQESRGAS
jgi:hypothetical protein